MISNTRGLTVAGLVEAAKNGDGQAWERLFERYQPLVTAVTRRHRLPPSDAADVSQIVWLKLIDHLGGLREPRALPGWIATTTANACLDVLAFPRRTVAVDPQLPRDTKSSTSSACAWDHFAERAELDEGLVRLEARRAVRRGLAELTAKQRELLLLVVADPPVSYQQISRRLGLPIGSIGPTRARCLKKLQETGAVRALLEGERPLSSRPLAAAA